MSTLNISEIFYSIQGEGSLVGLPSVFIRTSGCNLRCVWCDTPYTSWHPEKNIMTVEQILEQIHTYPDNTPIVLTGGEPLLQDITELVTCLKKQGRHITIESNGTIYRDLPIDLISLSPKLMNSIPEGKWKDLHDKKRINIEVLAKFILHATDYQLKFVVNTHEDIQEIQYIITQLEKRLTHSINPTKIILMPQGKTTTEITQKYNMLVALCLEHNYRLSPRLHVDIWGDKRGV